MRRRIRVRDRRLRMFECVDCECDTGRTNEYYMVHDHLWPLASQGGMLCIGCLENRLGRQLGRSDFMSEAPVNFFWPQSERLASRLSA